MRIFTGTHKEYNWIEWRWRKRFLKDLIAEFPRIVLEKYLVNTALDSGSLSLSQAEIEAGWHKHHKLALSSAITDIEIIPFIHYDEWYVFPQPTTFEDYEVFVNYGYFSLNSPTNQAIQAILDRFWQQIERLAPESYLAEGESLFFVTRDAELYRQITQSLTD